MQLTEANLSEVINRIKELLLECQYSVTHVSYTDDGEPYFFHRSGQSIDSPQDIEDTRYNGKRVIAINSNIGVYFIPVDSKIVFYCNWFRVELPPARFRSSKEWIFTVAGQGRFELC